ncbi:hypothetical protein Tsp_02285 [Trichinella spiralis]|uniref:hypothetical protein n=1 Tax=Trichinella spiralis TaxID=6334 RepID=UPI0001EFCAAD|nr:hypothetical protein Tsp_02283 [Trichinella spiralis]XP_003378105.1 hypothetical protein Tsp_02285 [Trichinella spiralis]
MFGIVDQSGITESVLPLLVWLSRYYYCYAVEPHKRKQPCAEPADPQHTCILGSKNRFKVIQTYLKIVPMNFFEDNSSVVTILPSLEENTEQLLQNCFFGVSLSDQIVPQYSAALMKLISIVKVKYENHFYHLLGSNPVLYRDKGVVNK